MKTSIATVGSALALILAFSFVANDGVNAKDNSMKILERHQIEHECERTVLTFMRDFEDKHGKAADLFAKNGTFNTMEGADTIREHFEMIEERAVVELNALVATNILIDVVDSDHATGTSYVTHFQHRYKDANREGPAVQPKSSSPLLKWTYEFVRVGDEWKFSDLQFGSYFVRAQ
jgi:hypothetical protein